MIAWVAGTSLGPYMLVAPVGAGGMGEVWKARDTRVDRIVAVKRLKAEYSDRFQRESRAIAALNHPHICQLYDVGPDYLVMELVEGAPLKGPVPSRRCVTVGGANRRRLDVGAQQRHRASGSEARQRAGRTRVAPSCSISGWPRWTCQLGFDDVTQSVALTEPGVALGTVAYMSPEQAQGLEVDARSDVFSFGAVFLRALERPPTISAVIPFLQR